MARKTRSEAVLWIALAIFLGGTLASLGGRALEERPGFCQSCHEMDFFGKTWQESGAAKHHGRCIDCHSGPGIIGAVSAQMTGIVELGIHFLGHPRPALSYGPGIVPNENCLKCHVHGYLRAAHRDFDARSHECAYCHNHFQDRNFSGEIPLSMERYQERFAKGDVNE
ncbi:MAG: NapC/NirT family cytochrome c [Nitrospirae bacterium]|jgi:hypothetical protein|nr:MAG: NapC/NirT family cyctochrome C [Leptospirillum sp. Group IV 'UBA BS']MCL4486384.1 NapC/NirT family cytochrome c [Nitrospirota bacterium]MCL5285519.1 NapC/NirT family cytochrome c [Nitrospirota bacterium]